MDRIVVPSAQELAGELSRWEQVHESPAPRWDALAAEHPGW
ncbi:hypothetical protein [Allokutzneria sp. NRRL B-24872]|nr:hypothetical protein [Allokutzneria sp. NRRL B-24872]